MSLAEVASEVQSLSRVDKLRPIQHLARDFERDEPPVIECGKTYPVWSPESAFSAADTLLKALSSEVKQKS